VGTSDRSEPTSNSSTLGERRKSCPRGILHIPHYICDSTNRGPEGSEKNPVGSSSAGKALDDVDVGTLINIMTQKSSCKLAPPDY